MIKSYNYKWKILAHQILQQVKKHHGAIVAFQKKKNLRTNDLVDRGIGDHHVSVKSILGCLFVESNVKFSLKMFKSGHWM